MFSFAGLAISFVIGLFCIVNSFSAFTGVALNAVYGGNPGSGVAYGVGYLLTGLILIAAALVGIVLSIIFLIKNKELKFPLIPIIVLGCAAIMFVSYDIMIMVSDGTVISNVAKHIGDSSSSDFAAYYGMTIVTNLLDIFTNLAITLVVAALGVFSLITFKKKNAEPAQ